MPANPEAPAASDPAPVAALPCDHVNIPWYKSQRFIALCQSTAVYILGWVSVALGSNDWSTWKAMLIAVLGNILVALKDWWNPNIVAPFAALNKNNTVPVPPK